MTKKFRILGFYPDGTIAPFVSQDMYVGLKDLGHEVLVISPEKFRDEYAVKKNTARDELIATIRKFNPHFSIFYGTCGIMIFRDIHQGDNHLLRDLEIPIFPCFFDDPNFLIGVQDELVLPDETFIFIWDKKYLAMMREKGYCNSAHLPLGVNPHVFNMQRPIDPSYRHVMSFVGSIRDSAPIVDVIKQTGEPTLYDFFERAIQYKMRKPAASFYDILPELSQHLTGTERIKWDNFGNTLSYWNYYNHLNQFANNVWREQVVTSIAMNDVPIAVYGNERWKSLNVHYCGSLDYHRELPGLYRSTPFHLNLTAPQLYSAINNRVYDVLASGSMVLTDWRQELEESFDLDQDLLVFHSLEEAVELTVKWKGQEDQLRKMALKGRQRVLDKHTWADRMKVALEHIQNHISLE